MTFTLSSQHTNLDSVAIGIETILVFVYSFYFLYQGFKDLEKPFITRNPMFWIVVGIIFYLGGSFFFNILANHLSEAEVKNYWSYSYSFDIVKNILFGISIYFFAREKGRRAKEAVPHLDIDQMDFGRIIKHNQ